MKGQARQVLVQMWIPRKEVRQRSQPGRQAAGKGAERDKQGPDGRRTDAGQEREGREKNANVE